MNIRQKLALQFSLIVIVVLGVFSLIIYWQSADYRREDFYSRLESRAISSANLLLRVQQVDSSLQRIIDRNSFVIYDERTSIYTADGQLLYNNGFEKSPESLDIQN
ncbi:MAG TPA: hypothetical protein VFV37_11250, partial [Luteibaculaceae bacterium]|nr:hypothetical protein [Luteibaculaceae bacterium]